MVKRILTFILIICTLALSACTVSTQKEDDGLYYVRVAPYSLGIEAQPVYEVYEDYEAAKEYCDNNAVYGCIICNSNKKCIYTPYTEVGSEILYQAKIVCDFIRDDGFSYGNAPINPAYNYDEHLVSCDRLVDWILYRVGFTDQPYENGKCVSGPWLTDWCIEQGFKKISSISDLEPGDVIFIRADANGNPGHTFIYAGGADGMYYRYDAGSDVRIQSTQPSYESIDLFMYAYRPVKMPSTRGITYATAVPEAPTWQPTSYRAILTDDFDGELNWKKKHNIQTFNVSDGILTVKSTGTDPYFEYKEVLDIDCSEINTIRIRIRNYTYSTMLQVFFTTDQTTEYCAEASFTGWLEFYRVGGDTESGWEEIEIDLSGNELFTGKLQKLRIDPVAGSGKVEIDSISIGWTDK